jgi:hypothetical protein
VTFSDLAIIRSILMAAYAKKRAPKILVNKLMVLISKKYVDQVTIIKGKTKIEAMIT